MTYLALDLGAGSGRAIVGTIRDGKLCLEEVYRFQNPPVKLGDTLYWDFLSLYNDVKEGIRLAVKGGHELKGIAVDTWGVDFGLIDKNGRLLSNPVCYRDSRTEGMAEKVAKKIPREKLYSVTGIQELSINTLYQLYSMLESGEEALSAADKLLFTPDLINYFLTGVAVNEYTIASTSQFLDAGRREWATVEVLDKLGLPSKFMGEIVQPCSTIGKLKPEIAEETGALNARVFAVGSHDTASAIAAIPETGDDWAFVSSGTWSIFGVTSDKPLLGEEALANDFTNEGGCDNKILFMRNITGLWLMQRLIAEWEKGEDYVCNYEELLKECDSCTPFRSIVNNDYPAFSFPASMSKAIQEYCRKTGQPVPESKGQLVRCVLESLALKYRFTMESLKKCTDRNITKLHVAGGGGRNDLLNQYTANALDMEVVTGLDEGTAIGNIMAQYIADGRITGWKEAHDIVRESFGFKSFQPENTGEWDAVAQRIAHLFV